MVFSGENGHRLSYQKAVHSELLHKLDGKLVTGPDVALAQDLYINPQDRISVPVIIPHLSPPLNRLPPHVYPYARVAMRSRMAQLGLEVDENSMLTITESLKRFYAGNVGDSQNEMYEAKVDIHNGCARPIYLPEGTDIFKPYFWDGKPTVASHLLKLFDEERIKITGTENVDYRFFFDEYGTSEENIRGIEMKINEEKRMWIDDSTMDPLTMHNETTGNLGFDYRKVLNDLFTAIPLNKKEPILWIGETTSILTLHPSVHGHIDRKVGQFRSEEERKHIHRMALLLYGGRTDWYIRTEIESPTTPGVIPTSIFVEFIDNGDEYPLAA